MKKLIFGVLAIVVLCSHDMFLKLDGFFLEPDTSAVIQLFNGSFDKSENIIDRDRMLDASLVGNGERITIDSKQWYEKDSITFFNFKTGNAGTWLAGVSTKSRDIELDAEAFNTYLEHDGVLDMLANRKANNLLKEDAIEKYSKHVKTIFQVGDETSDDWKTNMGYPIEFIPLENPYDLHPEHTLKVRLLRDSKPLANQLVIVGVDKKDDTNSEEHTHDNGTTHSHSDADAEDSNKHHADQEKEHSHDDGKTHSHTNETEHSHDDGKRHLHSNNVSESHDHKHTAQQQLRTDENGIIEVELTSKGIWHLRTIHMVESKEENLTHESNWATLTFAVGSGQSEDHIHDDETHEDEDGFPSYIFWIGSLILLVILFLIFRKKKGNA